MHNSVELESAAVSDRGLSEKRPQNEDSYLDLPSSGIFAVADGVGGAQAGDVASQMAIEILGEAFANRSGGDAEEVMKIAIERANSAIYQMASDLPQLESMATTIVAIHLADDVATIGHVGDSRLYRFDPTGNVFRETADHSVVEEEVRAGRLTAEEAVNHPSKNVISRALGAEDTVEIDLKTIMAEAGTTFLLCSDGITRHINDQELREICSSSDLPADICQRLKDLCYARGAEDNLTAVIIRLRGESAINNGNANTSAEDEEEVTVATARAAQAGANETRENLDEFETTIADDHFPSLDEIDDESYLLTESEAEQNAAVAEEPTPAGVHSPVEKAVAPTPEYAYAADFPNDKSSIGRIVSSVALLLIGALIGAGAYYWAQPAPEPAAPAPQMPVITEMKSNNTALTAFEEGRRQVDSDPVKYLNAKAATPEEAEDYFLLGRAYMLTGKYWEAKRAFNEAKGRLAQVDANNSKTLSAEIAMSLAIIESPSATDAFSKSVAATYSGTPAGSDAPAR